MLGIHAHCDINVKMSLTHKPIGNGFTVASVRASIVDRRSNDVQRLTAVWEGSYLLYSDHFTPKICQLQMTMFRSLLISK